MDTPRVITPGDLHGFMSMVLEEWAVDCCDPCFESECIDSEGEIIGSPSQIFDVAGDGMVFIEDENPDLLARGVHNKLVTWFKPLAGAIQRVGGRVGRLAMGQLQDKYPAVGYAIKQLNVGHDWPE